MSLEVLCSLSYGSPDLIKYKFGTDNILPDDFFPPEEREEYLEKGFIKESDQPPNTFPKGEKIEQLPDLGKMKITVAREFLEDEYDVVKLEKYHDQESSRKAPRKKLLQWIERKTNELQGFEPTRTR